MADSIKIMVRVRPFNERQLTNNFESCIEMFGQQVVVTNPEAKSEQPRKFAFHKAYYSTDDKMGHPPVSNAEVFKDIGRQILDCIYDGYNATIFAYGQTGSGKSYSIQGRDSEKGLLQMCLEDIFQRRIPQNQKNAIATSVEVTYVQIYNQKLRDLLSPNGDKEPKVVQIGTSIILKDVHPAKVNSFEQVENCFLDGKKVRVVGGTAMNKNSSRSHAIFTVYYKQSHKKKKFEAKFNIVDLAGSQRQTKTGATGKRLEEANNINRSLTNLGIVIEKLAHNCMNKKSEFIPYRNSMLTHILSESLAGNSKTFMIAAISPADDNYEQTLGTLKFAQRASLISTKTKKNVEANEGYNKELLMQIQRLKQELEAAKAGGGVGGGVPGGDQAAMEGRIAGVMQQLDINKSQRQSLELRLNELQDQKKVLEMQRSKKDLLDPDQQQRMKALDLQILTLKQKIQNSKKTRVDLESQLREQKSKKQELTKELQQAKGQIGEQQGKAQELNERLSAMMKEVKENKSDRDSLVKQLEEEKKKREELEANRKKLLEEAGLSQQSNLKDRKYPYIMNASEDPTLLGMLLYDIKEGETKVGTKDADQNQIKINVIGIQPRHCSFFNQGAKVIIQPYPQAKLFINGILTTKKKELQHLDRITLGHANHFKLIIPGKTTSDDLRLSMAAPGQFGQYIDDKLADNTIEAKSMKIFLVEMQQRLDKHLFNKFLEKFKANLEDIDEVNQYTYERYRKFPLSTKNLHFRIQTLIDPENYMKTVPSIVIICEHKETKDMFFLWSQDKFQKRLSDMESWYKGNGKKDIALQTSEFDPWFDPTDHYLEEKAELEHMKPREAVELWDKKQAQNSQNYKKVQNQINTTLKDLHGLGYKQDIVEDYADFYFRNFPPPESSKPRLDEMRKKQNIHKSIHRYMECYAELKECEINNKFYNEQRAKYMKGKATQEAEPVKKPAAQPPKKPEPVSSAPPPQSNGGNNEGSALEVQQLYKKMEELQQEIKRQAKIIRGKGS